MTQGIRLEAGGSGDSAREVPDVPETAPRNRPSRHGLLVDIRADRFSGLYLAILLIIVFNVWLPHSFGTASSARAILADSAITGIVTLGCVLGLISGAFDISIGANMSFAISLVGWLQSSIHLNALVAVIVTLASGAVVGSVNAVVITRLRVEPVIATLGMSSLLAAFAFWVAGGQTIISGISPTFTTFGMASFLTIPVPVFYLIGIALMLWYLLDHTPFGRYLYASGANPSAARLAGLPVARLQWSALIMSGILSSFAGIVLTMQLGSASFGAGDSYLLPAFAAAFLGSTQIRPGRFNVPGTIVALYLLGIGVQGLQLRFPSLPWIADLFQGLALITAVALGVIAGKRRVMRAGLSQ
jgi:ribose transport system permease protein